ncbi:MAG: hypothetical protein KIS92_02565 [Planctomycetota bacterium]|nr:hypothetical protein [Planctomycetota bacterium]
MASFSLLESMLLFLIVSLGLGYFVAPWPDVTVTIWPSLLTRAFVAFLPLGLFGIWKVAPTSRQKWCERLLSGCCCLLLVGEWWPLNRYLQKAPAYAYLANAIQAISMVGLLSGLVLLVLAHLFPKSR